MSLIEHSKCELEFLGEDKMQKKLNKDILEIVEVFSKQEHSGGSGDYIIFILEKLLRFKNLTPLTGEDREWREVADGVFQNKRLSTIFKNKNVFDGKAYNIDGKVFTDNGGKTWFTSKDSWVVVDFPFSYTPPERVYLKEC